MIDIVKYYKGLGTGRNGAKMKFREKVMERCHISYPLFMNRVYRNNWTFLEREAIDIHLSGYLFQASATIL